MALHLAAVEPERNMLPDLRLQPAQLLWQADGCLKKTVIDRAQLPREGAPFGIPLLAREGCHAAYHLMVYFGYGDVLLYAAATMAARPQARVCVLYAKNLGQMRFLQFFTVHPQQNT